MSQTSQLISKVKGGIIPSRVEWRCTKARAWLFREVKGGACDGK